MSQDTPIALHGDLFYLLPASPSFWQWSRDGQWIEWVDGATIAHRDEVLAVLSRLSPRGLPGIEAIVLILAATKPHWGPDRVDLLARSCAADANLPTIVDAVLERRLRLEAAATLGKLDGVLALPAGLRASASAKASLIDFVFDRDRVVPPATAEQIVHELRTGTEPEFFRRRDPADAVKRLTTALQTLDRVLDRVDGDAVELWQKTGIDFDLAPADVTVPPGRPTRDLLRSLRSDEELGGLARVAADVLAAIRVPRALSPVHDAPTGGVSDLSNKGSLDQLLVSELAHDDLTLATRIAMGEAMYLRREPPARHPPVGRWIVIDSGIRLWGTGRLFATAVGLALAAAGEEPASLRVFRASGASLEPVSFTSRDGVANHLSKLIASPDPLPAIRVAAQRIAADRSDVEQAELIAITHGQTAADPGFLAALSAMNTDRLTIRLATVTAAGAFSLSTVLASGRTEIASAKLSVEHLSGPSKPTDWQGELSGDASLPMILRLKRFPLFLPARVQSNLAVFHPLCGLIGMSADRRLMQWNANGCGASELSTALPQGSVQALCVDEVNQRVHLLVEDRARGRFALATLDLATRNWKSFDVGGEGFQHVTLHQSTVLLVGRRRVVVLPPLAKEPSEHDVPPGLVWHSGRFYRTVDGQVVFVATPAGVLNAGTARGGQFFFDHIEHGPVRMRRKGYFESFADGKTVVEPAFETGTVDAHSAVASADGRRMIAHESNKAWYGFDLDHGTHHHFPLRYLAYAFLLGPAAGAAMAGGTRHQLLHNVPAVARTADGSLVLRPGPKPRPFMLGDDGSLRLGRVSTRGSYSFTHARAFAPTGPTSGMNKPLQKAEWGDGSTAWMDPRGLLHLVSSDPNLPQITLVLRSGDERLAGWLSTGESFGETYFVGQAPRADDRTVWGLLKQFASNLR